MIGESWESLMGKFEGPDQYEGTRVDESIPDDRQVVKGFEHQRRYCQSSRCPLPQDCPYLSDEQKTFQSKVRIDKNDFV